MTCVRLIEGKCSLGLFDGTPKKMQCAGCMSYSGNIRGLGDIVAKVTEVTGIAALAKKSGCNCGERRKKLNKIFELNA